MTTTKLYKNGLPNVKPRKLWTPQQPIKERSVLEVCNKHFDCNKDGFPTEQGWKDLSQILSIYSDPRFETSRYFLVKDGNIKEHIAVSSQIPIFSFIGTFMLDKLRIYAQKTDTKLLFAHNHPSGHIAPSTEDKNLTQFLQQQFIDDNRKYRFLGHAIIGDNGDTGIYSDIEKEWKCISQNKIMSIEDFPFNPKDNGLPQVLGSLGILNLADFAYNVNKNAEWDTKNWIPSFYINKNKQVSGIQYFNNEDFYSAQVQKIPEILKQSARSIGSQSIIFIMQNTDQNLFGQLEYFAEKTKMINDIYHPIETGYGYETLNDYFKGNIFHSNEKVNLVLSDSRVIKQKMRAKTEHVNNPIKTQTYNNKTIKGMYDDKYL